MKHWINVTLKIAGWLLIIFAVLLVVSGIWYGVTETRAFYDRQDAYFDLQPQRDSIQNRLDSLYLIYYDFAEEDTIAQRSVQAQIDSMENSDEYHDLFGTPAPPIGFSLAGMVSVIFFFIALVPLAIGIILVVVAHRKR